MNDNYLLGLEIAKDFNKKYGVITYSGTLAIEIALKSLHLKKGAKVLVLAEVCYSIINTIWKLGLIPVMVIAENQLYLTDKDIEKVINKEKIDCMMLVHQYGIWNNIDLNKYSQKGIKIIEDVAQAWKVGNNNYEIGKNSDIVVTSFGKSKPLSYGIGGGLFFNDESIFKIIDYSDIESREKEDILVSYTYPLCEDISYDKLKLIANKIVDEQKNNAKKYYELFYNQNIIKCLDSIENSVWHRYPIWVEDYKIYKKIITKLKQTDLEYQLSHRIDLTELKRNKKGIKYDNRKQKKYIILLRTRNVDINKQIDILKEIKGILV